MLRWQTEVIGMGVNATHIALAWRARGQTGVMWSCWSFTDAVELSALSALPAGPLRITLDDALVRQWVITAPEGTASMRELRSYAALRFDSLFGESANNWEIEADWQALGPMVCQAVSMYIAQRLQAVNTQLKRPIADRLGCGSRLLKLNQRAAAATKDKSNAVWVTVGVDHCTIWWLFQGYTARVTTLRTDTNNPWVRVIQEILRVDAQHTDSAKTKQVHWASLGPCTEPAHPTLHFVQHLYKQPIEFARPLPVDASATAVLLASRGCV